MPRGNGDRVGGIGQSRTIHSSCCVASVYVAIRGLNGPMGVSAPSFVQMQ